MQTIEYQIIPYIGNYMIQKVSTEDIQDSIINRMQKQGLSHSSIKKAYEALNGFFRQYVIERKYFQSNGRWYTALKEPIQHKAVAGVKWGRNEKIHKCSGGKVEKR